MAGGPAVVERSAAVQDGGGALRKHGGAVKGLARSPLLRKMKSFAPAGQAHLAPWRRMKSFAPAGQAHLAPFQCPTIMSPRTVSFHDRRRKWT